MASKHQNILSRRDVGLVSLLILIFVVGIAYLLTTQTVFRPDIEPIATSEEDQVGDTSSQKHPPSVRTFNLLSALPQHPLIKVYMNHNQAAVYTDPYRKIKRYGDNLEQIIITEINKAQVKIDLAVHELNLPGIALALVKKQEQGVKVRLIMENSYTRDAGLMSLSNIQKLDSRLQSRVKELRHYLDTNNDGKLTVQELQERDALYILNQYKLPWLDDTADGSTGSGIMHNKYVLIDGKTLITGSTNFTFSDVHGDKDAPETRGNNNNLLVITSPELVRSYEQDFTQMWGDGVGGATDSRFGTRKDLLPLQQMRVGNILVAVRFSPASAKIPPNETTDGQINRVLATAQTSVHLALFVFSAQDIADQLHALKINQPKLELAGVFDPGFGYRDFSETLDLWGLTLANRNCGIEADNHPWPQPLTTIGTAILPEGDKMHHKFAVIDHHLVITGSHNWSQAANSLNDENTLIIDNPTVAAHYEREFQRLYQTTFFGPSRALREKIKGESRRCPKITQLVAKKPKSAPKTVSSMSATSPTLLLPININTADAATLDQLPGISPATAQAIIEYRQTQGSLTSLADLDQIKGIGSKTLEKLQDKIIF